MNPFWKAFFDEFKDRGRDGTPFLFAVAIAPAVFIAEASGLHISEALPWLAAGMAVCFLVGSIVLLCRTQRPRERWERRELSSDELRVARSKLIRQQNRKSA